MTAAYEVRRFEITSADGRHGASCDPTALGLAHAKAESLGAGSTVTEVLAVWADGDRDKAPVIDRCVVYVAGTVAA